MWYQGRIQRRGHATHYDRTYSSNFVSETGYANPVYGREQVSGVIYGVIIMGVYVRAGSEAFAS